MAQNYSIHGRRKLHQVVLLPIKFVSHMGHYLDNMELRRWVDVNGPLDEKDFNSYLCVGEGAWIRGAQ